MRPTILKIKCPYCNTSVLIHSDFDMKEIQCGSCNKKFNIKIKKEVKKNES